jgi:transcriptional regulator with XRE-family HTH domain
MFFGENVRYLRLSKGWQQAEFADKIGIARSSVSQYETGASKPDFNTLMKIADIFNVSLNELVHIKLPESTSIKANNETTTVNAVRTSFITIDNKGKENIVFVDQKAAAGYAGNVQSPVFYKSLPTFSLPGSRYNNGTFRCFEITGESMNGSFKPGDWCISRLVDDITTVRDNYVYVVVTTDAVLIKRVINRIRERESIVLKSDNPDYAHIQLHVSEVKELWLGVGKFTWDLSNQDFDILRTVDDLHASVAQLQNRVKRLEDDPK